MLIGHLIEVGDGFPHDATISRRVVVNIPYARDAACRVKRVVHSKAKGASRGGALHAAPAFRFRAGKMPRHKNFRGLSPTIRLYRSITSLAMQRLCSVSAIFVATGRTGIAGLAGSYSA